MSSLWLLLDIFECISCGCLEVSRSKFVGDNFCVIIGTSDNFISVLTPSPYAKVGFDGQFVEHCLLDRA